MRKIFFFDVETTGLNPKVHGILSLSYIIDFDGRRECKRTLFVNPLLYTPPALVDPKALEVNGIKLEELSNESIFYSPQQAHEILLSDLGNHCDKFDPNDKMYMAAYRGEFDHGFLSEHFLRLGDDYFGSWFNGRMLDPLPILRSLDAYYDLFGLPDHKLKTMARYFDIELDAHKSDSDVDALRTIWYMVMEALDGPKLRLLKKERPYARRIIKDTPYEQTHLSDDGTEYVYRKEYLSSGSWRNEYSLSLMYARAAS